MLDFGWPELLLILAVAVLVIGPNEIPEMMRGLGRIVRRLQYMRFALSQQFDDFMRETDLEEMRREADLRTDGDTDAERAADEEEMMPLSYDESKEERGHE